VNAFEPSVSVVVAAYNAEATIDACISSLLRLRYPQTEVLVVDNWSCDGTADKLKSYAGHIHVLHERIRGAAAARNAGLRAASGEVVAFTDADCTVHPDWLDHLVAPLANHQVGIAGGMILAREGANEVERFGDYIHDHRRTIELVRPPYAITMNWASPRSALERLGGFDERFLRAQDTDLSFRFVEAGYRLAFAPHAVVYHRNEATLGGLFREGVVHGFHFVLVRKRHQGLLPGFGPRQRFSQPGYTELARRLVGGTPDGWNRCYAVYISGKKVGYLLGSARHGYLYL
jgi:GT2 family glycosyltransferase